MWQMIYSYSVYWYNQVGVYLNAMLRYFQLNNQDNSHLALVSLREEKKENISEIAEGGEFNSTNVENAIINHASINQAIHKKPVDTKIKSKQASSMEKYKTVITPIVKLSKEEEVGEELQFKWNFKNISQRKPSRNSIMQTPGAQNKVQPKVRQTDELASKELRLPQMILIDYPGDIFNYANENYIKLFSIHCDIIKNNSKTVSTNIRNQVYFSAVDMLEELKQALSKISPRDSKYYPLRLINRINTIRNILADRPDYLLSRNYTKDSFVSCRSTCLLNIVLNTYLMVNTYLASRCEEVSIDNSDLEQNAIYKKLSPNNLALPIKNPWQCLLEIYQLLTVELLPVMSQSNGLKDFLTNEQNLINARVLIIKLGSYVRVLKDQYPEFCQKELAYNLNSLNGLLFISLEKFARDGNFEFLQKMIESWPTERVLAVCVSLRNDAVHFQSSNITKEQLSKKANSHVLFFILQTLGKALPEITQKLKEANLDPKVYLEYQFRFFKDQQETRKDLVGNLTGQTISDTSNQPPTNIL